MMRYHILFLAVIIFQVGLTGLVTWRILIRKTVDLQQQFVGIILLTILGYELIREIMVMGGIASPEITQLRLLILRVEHTVYGMFIQEVIYYAKRVCNKKKR